MEKKIQEARTTGKYCLTSWAHRIWHKGRCGCWHSLHVDWTMVKEFFRRLVLACPTIDRVFTFLGHLPLHECMKWLLHNITVFNRDCQDHLALQDLLARVVKRYTDLMYQRFSTLLYSNPSESNTCFLQGEPGPKGPPGPHGSRAMPVCQRFGFKYYN